MLDASRRRLLGDVECLVLREDFFLLEEDAVGGSLVGRGGRPVIQGEGLAPYQAARFAR